ncbi:MAG: lipoprotein Spr [Bacteroidetes bacterium]|nr:MAG: lipoprotein Spr [Bacteroidota bacterium]
MILNILSKYKLARIRCTRAPGSSGDSVNRPYSIRKAVFVLLASFILSCPFASGQTDTLKAVPVPVITDSLRNYYSRFGLFPDSAESRVLYYHVHDWLGTRYLRGGHTKKGIDCSGFVAKMYGNSYGLLLQGGCSNLFPLTDTVSKKNLREGDMVFFKIKKGRISHVGIYLGNNKFAHATVHGGVMINDLDEAYYRKYYYSAGRLKESCKRKVL